MDKAESEEKYISTRKRNNGVVESKRIWAAEALEGILDRANHPDRYVLSRWLESLDYDDLERIESAMLFGRGDFGTYRSALKYVREMFGEERDKDGAIGYIYSKSSDSLIKYIRNALREAA